MIVLQLGTKRRLTLRKVKAFFPDYLQAENQIEKRFERPLVTELRASTLDFTTRLGWRILPVEGKRPTTPRGVYDASDNPDEVLGWLNLASERVTGLGVACGIGFDVVDIDSHQPAEWLERLVSSYEGPIALTPHGIHLYTLPFAIRSAVRPLPDIDIRTRGSYVVVPPSASLDGKRYAWIASPFETRLRPCPCFLRSKLIAADAGSNELTLPPPGEVVGDNNPRLTQYVIVALTKMSGDIIAAPVGTRNRTLYARAVKAGGYVAAGLIAIDAVITMLAAAGFKAGLTMKETTATVKSGLKAGMSRPWVPTVRTQKQ